MSKVKSSSSIQILGYYGSLICREEAVEIIPNKLTWLCTNVKIKKQRDIFVLNIDDIYEYNRYNYDFGPLDMSSIMSYCYELYYILKSPTNAKSIVIHQCGQNLAQKANSAVLICAYMVLHLNKTAEEAWSFFSKQLNQQLLPFRDSINLLASTFDITVLDCLKGIEESKKKGWINTFSFDHFKYLDLVASKRGCISQIVPDKLFAFRSPSNNSLLSEGSTAEELSKMFKTLNIKKVIQLNEDTYDVTKFTSQGISHVKIIFPDCRTPTNKQIQQFIDEVDSTIDGSVAVHCQAGLGRTGTMIALYCMKTYSITARGIISYIKMVRPGSIHGIQHNFILNKEEDYQPVETQKLKVKYIPSQQIIPLQITELDELDHF